MYPLTLPTLELLSKPLFTGDQISARFAYFMNDSRSIKRNTKCMTRKPLSLTKSCQYVSLVGKDFVQ